LSETTLNYERKIRSKPGACKEDIPHHLRENIKKKKEDKFKEKNICLKLSVLT